MGWWGSRRGRGGGPPAGAGTPTKSRIASRSPFLGIGPVIGLRLGVRVFQICQTHALLLGLHDGFADGGANELGTLALRREASERAIGRLGELDQHGFHILRIYHKSIYWEHSEVQLRKQRAAAQGFTMSSHEHVLQSRAGGQPVASAGIAPSADGPCAREASVRSTSRRGGPRDSRRPRKAARDWHRTLDRW